MCKHIGDDVNKTNINLSKYTREKNRQNVIECDGGHNVSYWHKSKIATEKETRRRRRVQRTHSSHEKKKTSE